MTRVIVNDASCLIDLRKGRLLEAVCSLPYQLVVPLPVRSSEVLSFSHEEWRRLDTHGMVTHDLPPRDVTKAFAIKHRHRALSANDCFCLATALALRGILLTGDKQLRHVASTTGVRVHGVLWVVDKLVERDACDIALLVKALEAWQADSTVFLPQREIAKRLKSLAAGRTGPGGR